MARTTWLAMAAGGLLSLGGAAAPPAETSECGLDDPVAPDFSLTDLNPSSPTVGQVYTLADFSGQVMVIYWATAT